MSLPRSSLISTLGSRQVGCNLTSFGIPLIYSGIQERQRCLLFELKKKIVPTLEIFRNLMGNLLSPYILHATGITVGKHHVRISWSIAFCVQQTDASQEFVAPSPPFSRSVRPDQAVFERIRRCVNGKPIWSFDYQSLSKSAKIICGLKQYLLLVWSHIGRKLHTSTLLILGQVPEGRQRIRCKSSSSS